MTEPSETTWVAISWGYQGGAPETEVEQLRAALQRARRLAPPERILTSVLEQDAPWWKPVLDGHPEDNVIVQPFERGSGTAVFLAGMAIARRDIDAQVALLEPRDPSPPRRVPVRDLLDVFRHSAPDTAERCEAAEQSMGPIERTRALDRIFPYLASFSFERVALLLV